MKIYYRGYVIHEDANRAGCTVENRRSVTHRTGGHEDRLLWGYVRGV